MMQEEKMKTMTQSMAIEQQHWQENVMAKFHLDDAMQDLDDACYYHADGFTKHTITVMTCWDSDRLDLGRVGIKPNAQYLCTTAAKKLSSY